MSPHVSINRDSGSYKSFLKVFVSCEPANHVARNERVRRSFHSRPQLPDPRTDDGPVRRTLPPKWPMRLRPQTGDHAR